MTSTGSLAAAVDKLAEAVDAAEAAAASLERAAADAALHSAAAAKADSDMSDLRRDHAGLKSVAGDVSRRLDGAIEQVEAILAGRP